MQLKVQACSAKDVFLTEVKQMMIHVAHSSPEPVLELRGLGVVLACVDKSYIPMKIQLQKLKKEERDF